MSKHVLKSAFHDKGQKTKSGSSDKRRDKSTLSADQNIEFLAQARKARHELAMLFPYNKRVACPTGVTNSYTPTPLYGPWNHVLYLKSRSEPDFVGVFDIESLGLLASAIHHAVALIFDPTAKDSGEDAYSRVTTLPTWASVVDYLKDLLARLYVTQKKKGLNRGKGRFYAHNGAVFDWSGLAKYLGIDINTELHEQYVIDGKLHSKPIIVEDEIYIDEEGGERKKHNMRWVIENFGDKPRIYLSCGSQNAFVIELLDSFWVMNVPLSALGSSVEKGITPKQFTHTIEWLHGEGFNVSLEDIHPYLEQAHRYELTPEGDWVGMYAMVDGIEVRKATTQRYQAHPRGLNLSQKAYEALVHWKRSLSDEVRHYSATDVVVLANALCRFYTLARELGVPNPASFNTAAMIGLAAMVKCAYDTPQRINDEGKVVSRFLPYNYQRFARYKNGNMVLLTSGNTDIVKTGGDPSKLITPQEGAEDGDQFDDLLETDLDYEAPAANERVFQDHGYVESRSGLETYITNPWYCSKLVNQKFRIVQRGGRCEVFAANNPEGTAVVVIDAKSMYPSVMANGVKLYLRDLNQYSTVLLGYVDPRFLSNTVTGKLREANIFETRETIREVVEVDYAKLKELQDNARLKGNNASVSYEEMASSSDAFVKAERKETTEHVVGRLNALRFLQVRSGMFYVRLPRSKVDFFRKIPVIPQQIGGGDIDSRLVFADWTGYLETYVTAEELVLFLSEETVEDSAVEINLTRSLFGPILGIAQGLNSKGEPVWKGAAWSPFAKFVIETYKRRRAAQEREEAIRQQVEVMEQAGNYDPTIRDQMLQDADQAASESYMLKLLMNAGGYGPLAQMHSPSFDFAVEDLGRAADVVRRIAIQDPDWDRIGSYVTALDNALRGFDDSHEGFSGKIAGWENLLQRLLQLEVQLRPYVAKRRWVDNLLLGKGAPEEDPKQIVERLAVTGERSLALRILDVDHFEEGIEKGIDVAWNAVKSMVSDLDRKVEGNTRIITSMLVDYAESHLCQYEHTTTIAPGGRHLKRFKINLPDTTAAHAIRPWAVSITAKSRVALHLGMRAADSVGIKVMYCDTDSIHCAVPFKTGRNPEDTAREMLANQSFISLGKDLGQWDFEEKRVRDDLVIPGHVARSKVVCRFAFYASKKVYMFCDENYNILDCRARGVPRAKAHMQAAMVGYVMRISKLGDRRGINANNLRIIRLHAAKPSYVANHLGDKILIETPGLFVNFNRNYYSKYDSDPAVFDASALSFAEGQMVSDADISRAFYHQISVTMPAANDLSAARGKPINKLQGLEEAYDFYYDNCRIKGRAISSVRKEIEAEISELERVLGVGQEEVAQRLEVDMLVNPGGRMEDHPNYFEGEVLPF
jgi:hypothetical protein